MNYEKAYYRLFNEITDIIEYLKELQVEVENIIIKSYDLKISDKTIIKNMNNKKEQIFKDDKQ